MAYDEDLADRVRAAVPRGAGVTERKMFGGLVPEPDHELAADDARSLPPKPPKTSNAGSNHAQ